MNTIPSSNPDMHNYSPFCNSFNPLLTMSTRTPPLLVPSVCEPLHPESSLFTIQPFAQHLVSLSMDEGQDRGEPQSDTYTPFVSHGYTEKPEFLQSPLAFFIFLQLQGQSLLREFIALDSYSFESLRVSSILNTFAGYRECLRRAWSRLMRALHGNTPTGHPQSLPPVTLSLDSLLPSAPGTSLAGLPSSHTAVAQVSRIPGFQHR